MSKLFEDYAKKMNPTECRNLEELDHLVKNADLSDAVLVHRIFDRFSELTKRMKGNIPFGNAEFWARLWEHEDDDLTNPTAFSKATPQPSQRPSSRPPQSQEGGADETDEIIHLSPAQFQDDEEAAEAPRDLSTFYTIKEERQFLAKRFNARATEMSLSFNELDGTDQQEDIIERALQEILEGAGTDGDWAGITIEHPGLDQGAFGIRFQPLANISAHYILREMFRIMQSNKKFRLDDQLKITIIRIRMPAGSGRGAKRTAALDLDEWEKQHSGTGGCFLKIENNDDLCLARAVIVAKAKEEKHPQWNTIRTAEKAGSTLQKRMAQKLMEDAGLGNHNGPCGIPELQKIQDFLAPEYQLKVFQREGFCSMVFCGPKAEKVLALYWSKDHYDVITKLPSFFDSYNFCHHCNKGYDRKQQHRCEETCPCCYKQPKCIQDPRLILCRDCNRSFANQECFDNHKIERETTNRKKERLVTSLCTRVHRCETCRLQYETRKEHQCGMRMCHICNKNVERGVEHRCFIQPKVQREEPADFAKKKIKGWIFYDMETTQDTVYSGEPGNESYEHRVNLIITQKICPRCCDGDQTPQCLNCGEQIFSGVNALQNFCQWFFTPLNNDCVAFAHNGQGFDNIFILGYLQKNSIKPDIIARGLKILTMSVGHLKMLDSMAFVPMALSSMPKAFDLKELAKGYFPHFFNKMENWDLDQDGLPPAEMYGPGGMKPEARAKFLEWYNQHKGDHFNFRDEIVRYCRSDVTILKEAMMKFRKSFIETTGVDPFMSTITIASLCMEVFRTNFLKPDMIGLVPHGGYRFKYKYSKIAIKWLKWESQQRGIRIEHALNGGEQYLGTKRLDGRHGNTAYEFYGCAFHGCPKCYKNREQELPLAKTTAHQAYIDTRMRAQEIKGKGLTLIEKWECDLAKELKESPEMKDFFDGIDIRDPLDPRYAFFGGRTNATTLYHRCTGEEKIGYVDVCSLYPFVLKYKAYPAGHPLIFTENFEEVTATNRPYHGLIKCRILPPQDQYHPVLPLRTGSFFDSYNFCHHCNKGYDRKQQHRCEETCPCCYKQPKCIQDPRLILCRDCNRSFANQECFDNHKIERETTNRKKERLVTSLCTRVHRCETCRLQYETRKEHQCGMRMCHICNKNVERGVEHRCFIQPKVQREEPADFAKKKIKGWIFYDMETTQDTVYSGEPGNESYEHRVNLIITQKICPRCCDGDQTPQCLNCGEQIFSGVNALQNFCQWFFTPLNNDCVAFAHNGQGFDNIFILGYLQKNSIKPDIIARGLKILTMSVGHLKMLDSMAFVPMALSSMPKAFDLKELAKGYFPHFFNKMENWDLDQDGLPPAEMYGPGGMKPEARAKFLEWYNQHKGDHFNFRDEIVRYCRSDVTILKEAMMKFRKSFIETTGVDPFMSTITIASLCMEVFRTNFLKPDMIGLVPHGGYRFKYKYSKIAIKWLKWESQQRGIRIEHALNGGEQYLGTKRLDGRHGNTAYEFYGCAFHGCPKCYKNREQELPLAKTTAHQAYIDTRMRAQEIKGKGLTLIEKWECDLAKELKESPEMKDFFDGIDIRDPLDPRDAFFGGRTNATTLYHRCTGEEKIGYVDVCSLYPFVLKYKAYPAGHPLIFTENFEEVTATNRPYHGLIKCRILPPQDQYHPVLPLRTGKGSTLKLTFPLCAACSEERRQDGECDHGEEERALDGAWPTPEIYRALELGYRILQIFEVWHYEEWVQFDGKDQDSGMFTAYINHFLKLKTQASGWPAWVKSEEDKDKFIRDFEDKEGVKLDATKIEKNAAFRALAKLCLNSFWGKLGQSDQLSKTEYFKDPDKFFQCIADPAHEVSSVKIITEDMMMVSYTQEDNFIDLQPNTSPVIAAMVTSHARLTLFEYLHKLGRRCLYFDTDSLVYLTRPGDVYEPPTGSFLGDLTNELEEYGEEAFISEFASAGPKNYGFMVVNPETGLQKASVKIRGFTLSSDNQELLNFTSLRAKVHAFVESGAKEEIETYTKKITRKKDRSVVTEVQKKKYRVVYEKRRVLPDFSTVPYGYKA